MPFNVKRVVAIHSCKGGVGKSTIATSLGLHLASKEFKVGLCDLDICGPSIAELLSVDRTPVRWSTHSDTGKNTNIKYDATIDDMDIFFDNTNVKCGCSVDSKLKDVKGSAPMDIPCCESNDVESTKMHSESTECDEIQLLEPKIVHGIKVMTSEFLLSRGNPGYSAYRGPIIDQLCYEMVYKTNWDELDFLILDLPPGTSDVIISLVENITISGAVIVTTPHVLSYNDVLRGLKLFRDLDIPVVSMVENMSFYKCSSCSTERYIFGRSRVEAICKEHGINGFVKIPLIDTPLDLDKRTEKFTSADTLPSLRNLQIINEYHDYGFIHNAFDNIIGHILKNTASSIYKTDRKINRITATNSSESCKVIFRNSNILGSKGLDW